jgi:hypothetical protein
MATRNKRSPRLRCRECGCATNHYTGFCASHRQLQLPLVPGTGLLTPADRAYLEWRNYARTAMPTGEARTESEGPCLASMVE